MVLVNLLMLQSFHQQRYCLSLIVYHLVSLSYVLDWDIAPSGPDFVLWTFSFENIAKICICEHAIYAKRTIKPLAASFMDRDIVTWYIHKANSLILWLLDMLTAF